MGITMRRQLTLLFVLTITILYGRNLLASNSSAFLVIVNAQNPIDSLDQKILADIFFKKITHWPEDGVIQPIDLKADAPARAKFSEEVLNRSVMGVRNYWQQVIFSGRDVPPPEFKSDREVIHYVYKNLGSIGYVSMASSADISPENGVKRINIR